MILKRGYCYHFTFFNGTVQLSVCSYILKLHVFPLRIHFNTSDQSYNNAKRLLGLILHLNLTLRSSVHPFALLPPVFPLGMHLKPPSLPPLQCVGSHPYLQRCAEGSLYDGVKHECVSRFDETLKCGPQPEGRWRVRWGDTATFFSFFFFLQQAKQTRTKHDNKGRK